MAAIKLPNRSQRTVVVGRTGTGKTVAGLWHLSNYNLEYPWVLFNFKNDEHINSIAKAQHVDFNYLPRKRDRGLFVIHVTPYDLKPPARDEPSTFEKYCMKLWERENVGAFFDESIMIGSNDAFVMLLTQGRSKEIPMIICTQRPRFISLYAFSEASFIQVFDLNDVRDIQTVEGFVPIEWDEEKPLGKHQSFYYEVEEKKLVRLNPTPNMDQLRKVFDEKLHRQWVRI
jgi:hypothetical protein